MGPPATESASTPAPASDSHTQALIQTRFAAGGHSGQAQNVGLRCDDLLVFDVDGEQGEQSLELIQHKHGQLPATRVQQTGKGRHLLYRTPRNMQLGNSTRFLGSPPGLDLRAGSRGYVVAPPSQHANGHRYAWVDAEHPIRDLPDTYRALLVSRPRSSPGEMKALPVLTSTAYGEAALRGELGRLLCAREGERNATLNLCVFRLAQLVAGGELAHEELEQNALQYALLTGLERDESLATIRSATRAGLSFPRRRS